MVVALDYNSMYPSCMEGDFAEPRGLKYRTFDDHFCDLKKLHHGIYRVVLKGCKNNFFRNFHPLKFTKSNRSFLFKLDEKDSIETILHKNELVAYSKYFSEVKVIDGIESKTTIRHPLFNKAKRLYAEKNNLQKQNHGHYKKLVAHELQTLYSASSRKKYCTLNFNNYLEIIEQIKKSLFIDLSECPDLESAKKILNSKYIKTRESKGRIKISHVDFQSDYNIHSLTSQVVSNARVKMIKTLEYILEFEGSEICYTNTDSIHVSIEKRMLQDFFNYLSPYISQRMGDLKVECVADQGFWFDTGRYWLKNNNSIALYKNKIFNTIRNKDAYKRHTKIKRIHNAQAFSYVTEHSLVMENSFTYSKRICRENKIDHADLVRYDFEEIKNLIVAGETYRKEELLSREWLIELFNRVATNQVLRTRPSALKY
ncbi:hypothetical protein Q427_11525 [Halomonas sp. BC04]|nr:hypothetical protein Q427_11525 [Halomonas sp. BC04]